MKSDQASNEFYEKLKIQLYDTTSWPSAYLFKFIIETDQKKINHIITYSSSAAYPVHLQKNKK